MKSAHPKRSTKILSMLAVCVIFAGGVLYFLISMNNDTQSVNEESEVLALVCGQHNYREVSLTVTKYKNWKGDVGGYFIEFPGGMPGWGGTLYNAKGEKLGNIDSLPPEYSETKETEGLLLKMKISFPFETKTTCPI